MSVTTLILGRDRAIAEWVRQQLGDQIGPTIEAWGPMAAIGIARNSEIVAGIVYNNFRWPSIEASIASTTPSWCSRRNLAAIFAFPFWQLGCRRLGALTEVTNQPARAFLYRLGFRQEGLLRDAWRTGDAVLYGMTPAECRWLPVTLGQRNPQDGQGGSGGGDRGGDFFMSGEFVRAPEQPYGVECTTVDGLFIKQIIIPRAETIIPQHAHVWDHTSMLAVGAVALWKDGILDRQYRAPCAIFIKAGVKHRFASLEDNTIIYCLHNLHGEAAVKVLEEHHLVGES